MRRKRPILINMIVLVIALATSLQAQVIPGRWEKADALQPGEPIIVTLKNGEQIKGEFQRSLPNELFLLSTSDPTLTINIAKREVAQVVAQYADGSLNGTLIGALAGFGLIAAIAFPQNDFNLGLIPVVTGAGAVAGLFIDRSRKSGAIIYRAAAP